MQPAMICATATDHAALTPFTAELSPLEAEAIFQRALQEESTSEDAVRFTGHMLMEKAHMSTEDGLVMHSLVELGEAAMLMTDLAVGLARRTYRL